MICYHASHEQFSPSYLLKLVQLAEKAGFDGIHSSEHFYPWSVRQGHSGFTFSWIGAAMQATSLPFSMVCAPGGRYHPAVVAQAISTLSEMFPGRFHVELGSGEALNEAITGEEWPDKESRNERLLACADVIRSLLSGEEVTRDGIIKVKEAKLYTLPPVPPLLYCAALTEKTAAWAGSWADGLLTTKKEVVKAFRENGGEGKPVSLQLSFSYARSLEDAVTGAWDQWRNNISSPEQLADISKPEHFDELAKDVTPEDVMNAIPVFTSMNELRAYIDELKEFNPTSIILHNVNKLHEDFIEDYIS